MSGTRRKWTFLFHTSIFLLLRVSLNIPVLKRQMFLFDWHWIMSMDCFGIWIMGRSYAKKRSYPLQAHFEIKICELKRFRVTTRTPEELETASSNWRSGAYLQYWNPGLMHPMCVSLAVPFFLIWINKESVSIHCAWQVFHVLVFHVHRRGWLSQCTPA